MVTRPFSSVIGMSPIGEFKNRCFGANVGAKIFGRRLLIIHLTMVFGPKFQYFFFFQLNEMRDEAKTWWLVSGPDVASSYF